MKIEINIGEFHITNKGCSIDSWWIQREHGNGEGMELNARQIESLEKAMQKWWEETF